MRILSFSFLTLTLLLWPLSVTALATPEHARKTGQGCTVCHISPSGGALNERGLEYAASGYRWPAAGGYRVIGPIRRPVRFLVGLIHIVASFLWFGTILYVHLLLRPGYAAKGLPGGEVLVGLTSMGLVGLTGLLLTISRIRGLDVLYGTEWGLLLSAKIFLYLVMVSSALVAVFIVGPRLRLGRKRAALPPDGVFDPLTLAAFDGKDGRPPYVAFDGRVYDLSTSALWKEGQHMRRHAAGGNLTDALAMAPHGEEKLASFKVIGTYNPGLRAVKTAAQKAFYFIAYMNLSIVFAVLFILALWRWGI